MHDQVRKYAAKLMRHGLIEKAGDAGLYGLDDEIYTNRDTVPREVKALFERLTMNSLLIARPEPLRWGIIQELVRDHPPRITPCDCESLTFIHDIPVLDTFDIEQAAFALNRRKGCIVRDTGIVSTGSVSLEQTFITMSSICFSTFVKFFTDTLNGLHGYSPASRPDADRIGSCLAFLAELVPATPARPLSEEIPRDPSGIMEAMDAAGKALVASSLVDSFFGNISFRQDDLIYISQTGSSLDELPGHIDCVPIDGSSSCSLTSSSELESHAKIYELTKDTAILHGHPKFSVIMSMYGDTLEFGRTRWIGDVPVVAGEVGSGRRGLVHTLPKAMQESHAAIVSGHGTFASTPGSFRSAFETLSSIERSCFERYKEALLAGLKA